MAKLTLLEARNLLGWSRAKLAEEAGIKSTAVSDMETGRTLNPGYTTVVRLVAALQRGGLPGIKAEDIFPVPGDEARTA